jgi:hypothetical protein
MTADGGVCTGYLLRDPLIFSRRVRTIAVDGTLGTTRRDGRDRRRRSNRQKRCDG